MDARTAKLPKWAQERIHDLERDIEQLRKQLHAVAEGTEKAPFFYEFFDREKIPFFYIPRHARLQHCNGDPNDRRGVMEFQHGDNGDGEWVTIYAHDGVLHVQPVASNVVKIKVEQHR